MDTDSKGSGNDIKTTRSPDLSGLDMDKVSYHG